MSNPSAPSQLLSIPEVAEQLGVNIRHIRRLVHERRIPFIKWGHLIRFRPADIESWINANRVEPGGQMRPAEPVIPPRRGGPAREKGTSQQLRLGS